jgi:putative ABC transport system substrate-binding protein
MSYLKQSLACLLGAMLSLGALQGHAHAAGAKPYRITMVVFRGCEESCNGFRDYWKDRRLPVDIEVLDAALDPTKLPGFVTRVKATRPDLLVTWGTTVSLAMLGTVENVDPAKHVTDIPALFMIASTPVGSGLVRSLAAPGRNVSGTLYLVPVETQLNAVRLYLPFERVGYLLNPIEDGSKVVQADLMAAGAKQNFTLVARKVPLTAAGKPDAQSLEKLVNELADQKVDFLYMSPDSFHLLNRDGITSAALKRRLPVLASAEAAVIESNALLGVVNRYKTVGRLTASKAEQILLGQVQPKDMPVVAPPGFSYIVNMRVATELNRYPPINVLKIAEVVR